MSMNHDTRWMKYYKALLQYLYRYGDALVPSSHIEFLDSGESVNLGRWVTYMRTRYRQKALSAERISLLEELPSWSWGPVRPGPKSKEVVIQRNNHIVWLREHEGMALAQIAKRYNLSRQRVHQIVKENEL